MIDKEIIQALKNNRYPFGMWANPECYGTELGGAMQAKAKEIGKSDNFDYFGGKVWALQDNTNNHFIVDKTYSLRPDYEPLKIIVEKAIYPNEAELCIDDGGEPTSIHILLSSTRFIGFKYEDGGVRTDSIMYMPNENYKGVNHKCEIEGLRLGEVKVIRATHALFQVTK